MSSQREALLSLYRARRGSWADDGERTALLDELYGTAGPKSEAARSSTAQALKTQSAGADPATAPSAEQAGSDASVLDAEVLEALVTLAHDATDRREFTTDPGLVALAETIVVDDTRAADLLRVVFDLRYDDALASIGPVLRTDAEGRVTPEHEALAPQDLLGAAPTMLGIARDAVVGAGIELVAPLREQSGARCRARLVPVELGGEGEYAISFRTDVCLTIPPDLEVGDFIADLFEPSQWPKRHPFWISMDEIPRAEWTAEGRALVGQMEQAQLVGEAAGAVYGHRRIFNEAVGNRNSDGGTWPGTVLVFADSHRPGTDGTPTRHYLEYRLVPGISKYLLLDNGTIQITENGRELCCTVTKMLFFSEERHSTQAEVMADYACISGWAEQTRTFLTNWIDYKRSNPGGTS